MSEYTSSPSVPKSANNTSEGRASPDFSDQHREIPLTGSASPGVRRIQVLAKHITTKDRVFFFVAIFLVAYAYGLDGGLRYTYQAFATASYSQHSLLATVAVVRSVIAAAAQPTAAKLADVFGRVELIFISIVFYVVGTIVETFAFNVHVFAAGALLYQIGFTCILLLIEVIIGDITSTRSRLIFSYVPATPFIINAWVSGTVSQAVLTSSDWQWGIGMWAIIYTVCALPLIVALFFAQRRAKKYEDLSSYRTPYQMLGARRLAIALFWQLDVVGVILMIAMLGCVLVPFTIAGDGTQGWNQVHIILPLAIGFLLMPVWAVWEAKSPHPMVPFRLLKDRAVWSALGLACMLNFAWYCQADYLYTVAQVAFDQSVLSATRITQLYSFTSVITGAITGITVFYVRRLKPFVIAGTCLFLVAFGILIYFRGGTTDANVSGLIGAQVLLGIAGGLFPYTAQASIQVATKHEHLAVITGLYLATYNIGSALGNAVSGAIWRQVLPGELARNLAPVTTNSTMAALSFADPFSFIAEYPVGTPERTAVIDAYRHTQWFLCVTGACLCVPLIFFGLCLRNPRLTNTQSLPDAEKSTEELAVPEEAFGQDKPGFGQKVRKLIAK